MKTVDDETASTDLEKIFASGRRSRSNSVVHQKLSTRSEGAAYHQQRSPPKARGRLSLSTQGYNKTEDETEKNDFRPVPKPRSKPPASRNVNAQNMAPSEGLVPGSLTEENETPSLHLYNDSVIDGGEMKMESMAKSPKDYLEETLMRDRVDSAAYPDTQGDRHQQPVQHAQSEMPVFDDSQENQSSTSFTSPPPSPMESPPDEAETHDSTTNEHEQETVKPVQQYLYNSSRGQLDDRGGQKDVKTRLIYSRDKRRENSAPMTERTKLRDQLSESEQRNRTLRQRLDKLSLKSEQLIDENIAIKRQLEQGLETNHLISSFDQIGCLPPMILPVLYAPWDPQQNLNADINSLAARAKALESALEAAASVPHSHYDEFARSSFRQTPSVERTRRRPATTGRSERASFSNTNQQEISNGPPVPRLQLALTDRSVVPLRAKSESTTNGTNGTNGRRPSSTSTQSRPARPRTSQSLSRASQKSSNRPGTSSSYRPPRRPSSVGPSGRTIGDDQLESAPSISKKPVFARKQSAGTIAPFQPNNYLDVQPGYEAKFIRENGELDQGIVRYVGPLPNKKEPYMGIELQLPNGKHDGIYRGHRYFNWFDNL